MADRDLEERSHAYWRALAAQPQHRAATESLADGYTRGQARHIDQRNRFGETDSSGEIIEHHRRRRTLSP
jgi:hypothetical protein